MQHTRNNSLKETIFTDRRIKINVKFTNINIVQQSLSNASSVIEHIPARTYFISGINSRVYIFEINISNMSRILYSEIHLAPSELLLPRKVELARQVSRYL